MSANEIVLEEYEVAPSSRTITRYCKDGMAGKSPVKMGPTGNIPQFVFDTMCQAFSSMININQLNGSPINTMKKLRARISALFGEADNCALEVLKGLLNATAVDLLSTKCQSAEHRRIQWTTYHNIKTWFDNWEVALVELGFAETINGEIVIPEGMLARKYHQYG